MDGARKRAWWTASSSTTGQIFWEAWALPMAGASGGGARSTRSAFNGVTIPPDSALTNSPWKDTWMFTGIIESWNGLRR